ncbi:deoxyribose-phosphate aldolase [Legionella lytica]|uniref:Deoxyribose-phosphate aldolase n=1 Tax=Legionella lytica TaxID=96232 RepID=A0ABY4Y5H3_9GAMM|nr:deoxyribose-phosphate aldolase [Legionella lytica]USQ12870.1 deoxyribose-phosphate aldolase [Legionella lytica]
MILESSLNEVLGLLLNAQPQTVISAKRLIHALDLTLLDEEASSASLSQLKHDACENQVAAVCVYGKHLPSFQQLGAIELATVVNFPDGNEELNQVLDSIHTAIELNATEIDYVLPYRFYLEGRKDDALTQCQAVINLCKQENRTLKIILETGAFAKLQNIYEVSNQLIELGCNFLKTSTGKIPQGASLPAVFTMLTAIKDSSSQCGIKISGGVKTPTQAANYAKLAELVLGKPIDKRWFRIGASSLLAELNATLTKV